MSRFIFQAGDFCSAEKRAIREIHYDWKIPYLNYNDIESSNWVDKNRIPIGSVGFCTKYMQNLQIKIPQHLTYPPSLFPMLKRDIAIIPFGEIPDQYFCKPYSTIKQWTGGIKENIQEIIDPSTLTYCSPPVKFLTEARYYIHHMKVVGMARYDDGEIEFTDHEHLLFDFALECIALWPDQPIAFGLDIGIMDDGQIALVEVNDAWALGFYPWGDLEPREYALMLEARWAEITKE